MADKKSCYITIQKKSNSDLKSNLALLGQCNIAAMKKDKVYSLCEAVADITYIASTEKYRTDNSREMIGQFIEWAKEFEKLHKHIQWGVNSPLEYIDSIYHFTIFKINQWSSI